MIYANKKPYIFKRNSFEAYSNYVDTHISNVMKADKEYRSLLYPYMLQRLGKTEEQDRKCPYFHNIELTLKNHDETKFSDEEFRPYAAKFFPTRRDINNKETVDKNFELAWKHHYENNPHHPEFWIDKGGVMTTRFFYEMILDWIAVSMYYKSSVNDWYFKNPSGRKEKSTLLPEGDILLLDRIFSENKFDFSES